MYVHIGKDIIIKSEHIIAIFDIQTLEKKNSLENICKSLRISDKMIDVSDNHQKSLIVIEEQKQIKGYISNISSTTLGKRTSKYERMDRK